MPLLSLNNLHCLLEFTHEFPRLQLGFLRRSQIMWRSTASSLLIIRTSCDQLHYRYTHHVIQHDITTIATTTCIHITWFTCDIDQLLLTEYSGCLGTCKYMLSESEILQQSLFSRRERKDQCHGSGQAHVPSIQLALLCGMNQQGPVGSIQQNCICKAWKKKEFGNSPTFSVLVAVLCKCNYWWCHNIGKLNYVVQRGRQMEGFLIWQ